MCVPEAARIRAQSSSSAYTGTKYRNSDKSSLSSGSGELRNVIRAVGYCIRPCLYSHRTNGVVNCLCFVKLAQVSTGLSRAFIIPFPARVVGRLRKSGRCASFCNNALSFETVRRDPLQG